MNNPPDWFGYYKIIAGNQPTKILIEAIQYVDEKKYVLELGAGTPKDSKFLLDHGFIVVALDKEVEAEKQFLELKQNNNFQFILSSFENFDYPIEHYNLISAERALPFLKKKTDLITVLKNIKKSLKNKGIFVGHFFGPNDTWCKEGKEMTFVNREEIESMLNGMEIIKFVEREEDSQTTKGTPHHWHVFDVIARKK